MFWKELLTKNRLKEPTRIIVNTISREQYQQYCFFIFLPLWFKAFKSHITSYFCMMTRAVLFVLTLLSIPSFAQVRVSKFLVKKNETYRLEGSDIIVADTLIMMDSSRIRLNELKPQNFIRARVAIFGKHCIIDGKGIRGANGKDGVGGTTLIGPCREGTPGKNGSRGLDGGPGINLFLYIDQLIVNGSLIIDISGGNGGDGGQGGQGGGGSPGTLHCSGGTGGAGGNGGRGGNGGVGGALLLGVEAEAIRTLLNTQVFINVKGGNFGYGGTSGYGGSGGPGPTGKSGHVGARGADGFHGRSGNHGSIQFEQQ
jgi:hypothetical protein